MASKSAAKPVTNSTKPAPAAAPKAVTAGKSAPATKSKGVTKKAAAKNAVAKITAATATAVKSPAAKPAQKRVAAKKQKAHEKKQKTIRDSFNMPADDYALIAQLKKRAIQSGREMKKSELLRAGLKAIAALNDAAFVKVIGAVAAIKTGRPVKKHK